MQPDELNPKIKFQGFTFTSSKLCNNYYVKGNKPVLSSYHYFYGM